MKETIVLCIVALAAVLRPGKTTGIDNDTSNNEAEIRELIDGFIASIRAKDMKGVISVFSPDVVSFDFGPPLQHGGGEDFEKRWRELFDAYDGAIGYELRDLTVTADDNIAFSHSLNHVYGTLKNGRKSDRWIRWTACFRNIDGKWLIIHEHVSDPVDARSGKVVLDLKP